MVKRRKAFLANGNQILFNVIEWHTFLRMQLIGARLCTSGRLTPVFDWSSVTIRRNVNQNAMKNSWRLLVEIGKWSIWSANAPASWNGWHCSQLEFYLIYFTTKEHGKWSIFGELRVKLSSARNKNENRIQFVALSSHGMHDERETEKNYSLNSLFLRSFSLPLSLSFYLCCWCCSKWNKFLRINFFSLSSADSLFP